MIRLACIAPICATLGAAVSALLLTASAAHAAKAPDDLGMRADVEVARLDIALQNIAPECQGSAQHILYYVDGSEAALLKVRTRSPLGAFLDTRLHRIELDDWSRSHLGASLGPIEASPEVARAKTKLGASFAPPPATELVDAFDAGAPIPASELRLPREINGVTLEQALDQVARSFGAIVTIATCDRPRLIEFEVSNLPIEPRGSDDYPPRAGVDDLGVAAQVRQDAVEQSLANIRDGCTRGLHALYYVDASDGGLVEVEMRSDLQSILDTRLQNVELKNADAWDGVLSVLTLMGSPEVTKAQADLHAETPEYLLDYIASTPFDPRVVRLPKRLRDLTLREALNTVARTFGSTVSVAVCEEPRRIDTAFVWGAERQPGGGPARAPATR
ncbi:MAG TPA: hypothetical protein VHX64_11810 [Caulobacteraceae bacterium]|jgi:hypothetical protein|nr:hypothetical protein [Caulobacteraceae bacterium]